jgi:hypothetical protein
VLKVPRQVLQPNIYNRVILENSIVRVVVSSLAKFGVSVPDAEAKKSIKVLLTR